MNIIILTLSIGALFYISQTEATGVAIVAAVRTQIGVPYSWGGGGYRGKSKGIQQGKNTVGFDCSGLAQFGVYKGTKKVIARTAATQYSDKHCKHVAYAQRKPGDLVFYNDGGSIHHVAIISSASKMIEAPHTGATVHETPIRAKGRMALVQRCA